DGLVRRRLWNGRHASIATEYTECTASHGKGGRPAAFVRLGIVEFRPSSLVDAVRRGRMEQFGRGVRGSRGLPPSASDASMRNALRTFFSGLQAFEERHRL